MRKGTTDILTIVSITMVLILIGFYGSIAIHSNRITTILKENVNIMVELEEKDDEPFVKTLMEEFRNNESLIPESVEYIDAHEAQKIMVEEMGSEYLVEGMENPFRSSIIFNVKGNYFSKNFIADIKQQLASRPGIVNVYYQEAVFDVLLENFRKLSLGILVVGIFLLILAMALIYNTVFLSLNNDKQKIQTMELVGARWSYIRKPYLQNAFFKGLLSGLTASFILFLLVMLFKSQVDGLETFLDNTFIGFVLLAVVLTGIMIPYFATFFILNRYLKKIYL